MGIWRKWHTRTWQERRLLIEAFALLGIARFTLLTMPFRRIAPLIGEKGHDTTGATDDRTRAMARLVGTAVRTAARSTPWESVCLPQAMAGQWMLRRRGIAGTLYLGVKKTKENKPGLAAHAWLRCGELIITGRPGMKEFTMVGSFGSRPSRNAS